MASPATHGPFAPKSHTYIVAYLYVMMYLSGCGALQPDFANDVGNPNGDIDQHTGFVDSQHTQGNHMALTKAAVIRRQQRQQQHLQHHQGSDHVSGIWQSTAVSAAQAPASISTATRPYNRRRRLQQLAGLGNLLVGAKIAGNQQGVMAAGVASQLANFYGLEGLGFRHNLGALPSPGALELMAAGGLGALPSSEGLAAGFVGQTIQSLASTANPVTASALGQTLQAAAASTGLGSLAGAAGLSKLGIGSDSSGIGLGAIAGTAAQALGLTGTLSPGALDTGSSDLETQGYLSAEHAGISDKAATAAAVLSNGAQTAGQVIRNKGQLAGAVLGTAGQVAGALISTAGQIKGQILSNAAQVKGSVVTHAADVKGEVVGHAGQMAGQAIQGMAQAAEIVAQNKDAIKSAVGAKVGSALKGAGELLLAKFGDQSGDTVYHTGYASHISNDDGANGNVYYDNGQTMTMVTGGSGDTSGLVTATDSSTMQPGASTRQVVVNPAYSSLVTSTNWAAQNTAGTAPNAGMQAGSVTGMVPGTSAAQSGTAAYATQQGAGQQPQVATLQGQQGNAGQLMQGTAYQIRQGMQQPAVGPGQQSTAAAQVQQGMASMQQGYTTAAGQLQQGPATAAGQLQQGYVNTAGQMQQGTATAANQLQQGAMTAAGQAQQGYTTAAGQMQQGATTAAGQMQQGTMTAAGQTQQGLSTAAGQMQQGLSTAAGQMQPPIMG